MMNNHFLVPMCGTNKLLHEDKPKRKKRRHGDKAESYLYFEIPISIFWDNLNFEWGHRCDLRFNFSLFQFPILLLVTQLFNEDQSRKKTHDEDTLA